MKLPIPLQTLLEKLAPRGYIPPSDIDAEYALLGACMVDKPSSANAIEVIGQRTEENSPFYRVAHTLVYLAMLRLEEKSEPIDLLSVKNQMVLDGTLEKIGGTPYLVELTTKIATTVNTAHYARTILEKYVLRETIRLSEEIKLRCFEGEVDAFEITSELESRASDILEERHSGRGKFKPISQVSQDTIKILSEAGTTKGEALSFGLKELDEMCDGGSRVGEFVTLASRSGQGKTAMAATFARALKNKSTAVFSLEMSGPQLTTRLLCGEAKVSLKRARRGWLNQEEWDRIMAAHKTLAESGLYVFDTRDVTLSTIRSAARHLATKLSHTERPLGRIVLDYIDIPELPGKKQSHKEIGDLAKGLRNLGGELGTDMIVLSQITRDVAKRKPPRPTMSDIAESGDLEEVSNLILLLYRPETYEIHADEAYQLRTGSPLTDGLCEVIVAKQRDGETGMVLAKFIKDQARFEDWPTVFPGIKPETKEEVLF